MSFAKQIAAVGNGGTARIVPVVLWASLALVTGTIGFAIPTSAQVDWLGLTLTALTVFLGAVVASFSSRYMRADGARSTFFLRLAGLVASVVLFLNSQTLIGLAIGWIASGVLLASLIGHNRGWAEARAAARRTTRSFLVGDAALLAAFVLFYLSAGTVEITAIGAAPAGDAPATAFAVAGLLLVAALSRCATPPFSGWLLSSMTAPTPVSALMHAGMVNAGGFLLIRFAPVIEAAPGIRLAAVLLGLSAAIYGICIMSVRPDVKRSLAGSTISQMGFMIMSCGLGAYAAALWHIVAHGLFKAWLFLGSGSTIGMQGAFRSTPLRWWQVCVAAGVTLGIALIVLLWGEASASIVPLLLGAATAIATLSAGFLSRATLRAGLPVAALIFGLVAMHAAGLAIAGAAVGPDAPALLPDWSLLAILGAFLAAWLWQHQRQSTGRTLPPALYVHLLNAGSLRPAAYGEAK